MKDELLKDLKEWNIDKSDFSIYLTHSTKSKWENMNSFIKFAANKYRVMGYSFLMEELGVSYNKIRKALRS